MIAGESGNNTVQIKGLTALGANAKVTMQYVPGSGRTTNVGGPTTLSTVTYPISVGASRSRSPTRMPTGRTTSSCSPASPGWEA